MSRFFQATNKIKRLVSLRFKNYLDIGTWILKISGLALLVTLFASTAFAVTIPPHQNFVTDTSEIISDSAEAGLNEKLKAYEAETGTEIAVLTLPLIPDGLSANEYATEVGNAWGVGKARVDNGALLLIETDDAPGQRDIYIATGSQLEGGLTDIESRDIVDNVIIPQFREGNLDLGVENGVDAMIATLKGESFTDLRMGDVSASNDGEVGAFWFEVIFFVIFFIFPWAGAILGRSKAIWPGGVIGGVGGTILGFILAAGWATIALAIFFGAFGLFLDFVVSRNYTSAKKSGSSASWWAGGGGFGGGGSSSGGGFGGFSGGGFSGGGGGGRW